MGEGAWLVIFLIVQRLAELGFAQWNTGRLRAEDGVEFGAAHYPLLVALHTFWLLGLWLLGHDRSVDPFWLTVFILLQAGRLWVIATLGRRWTTRVIALPCVAPVARGPYRLSLIHIYPTLSEIGKRAAIDYFTPSLTSPWVRRIIAWLRIFG